MGAYGHHHFLGNACDDVLDFDGAARCLLGRQLYEIQTQEGCESIVNG